MLFNLDLLHYHFTQNRLRTLAAVLLLVNGLMHLSYILVFGTIANYAALTGVIYLVASLLLFRNVRIALWVGLIISILGAVTEIPEFYFLYHSPLATLHVILSVITAAICGYLIVRKPSIGDQ